MKCDNVAVRTRAIAEHDPKPLLTLLNTDNGRVCLFTRTQGILPAKILRVLLLVPHLRDVVTLFGVTSSAERAAEARDHCGTMLGVEDSRRVVIRTGSVSAFVKHVWTTSLKDRLFGTVFGAPRLHNRSRKSLVAKLVSATSAYASITAEDGRVVLVLLAPYNLPPEVNSWDMYWEELRHVSRCVFEAFHCCDISVDEPLRPVPRQVDASLRIPKEHIHRTAFMSYLLVHARMGY